MGLIGHVAKLLGDDQDKALHAFGLTMRGYTAMLMIYASPANELNPCELSHRMDISRTNITRLSDELVRKGLVVRRRCEEDRRRLYLSLTGDGQRLLESMLPEQHGYHRSLWKTFTNDEMSRLEQLLRKLLMRLVK